MKDQAQFFKALADSSRLNIIASLLESPKYIEVLAKRLELKPSTVSFHVKKLMNAGIVSSHKDQYYVMYSINKELLDLPLSHWINLESLDQVSENMREKEYESKIIADFFKFNKLKSIPVQRKKRLIILRKLVENFELGKGYTEREVNIIIADYHDDFATLRKEMVSENLMTRDAGIYEKVQ